MSRILVIDDDQAIAELVKINLELLGHQVTTANDGIKGLALAQQNRPDLVVLDVMMPDLDGFEVTRRLRSDPVTAGVPIFILSATADPNAEKQCLAAGATGFIRKPVLLRELADRIKKSLE